LGGDLISQTVEPDGSTSPAAYRPSENGYSWVYSVDNFFCQGSSYIICAGTGGQARCWLLSRTDGHDLQDWIYPPDDSVKRYDPFVRVVANTAYVAWVEGNSTEEGNVFFGQPGRGLEMTPLP